MSIATVVTRGYGSFGSIPFVVTRGYSQGAVVVNPGLGAPPAGDYAGYWRGLAERERARARPHRAHEPEPATLDEAITLPNEPFPEATLAAIEQRIAALQSLQELYQLAAQLEGLPQRMVMEVAAHAEQMARERDDEEAIMLLLH